MGPSKKRKRIEMTIEDNESSDLESLGKTQRMQSGKQIKTNDIANESANQSAVAPPKQRAVPAFLKAPPSASADQSITSDIQPL